MRFSIDHTNINVTNLENSIAFYKKALGMQVVRRKEADDGSFALCFLADESGRGHEIELTWLADHADTPYDLGENEGHIAFVVDDYEAAYLHHKEMGCICFENPEMGIYFINDPDDYWLEVIPKR